MNLAMIEIDWAKTPFSLHARAAYGKPGFREALSRAALMPRAQ